MCFAHYLARFWVLCWIPEPAWSGLLSNLFLDVLVAAWSFKSVPLLHILSSAFVHPLDSSKSSCGALVRARSMHFSRKEHVILS